MSEANVQQPAAINETMPQSPAQLRAFIAAELSGMLAMPENATTLAATILSASLGAIRTNAERHQHERSRLVVTRTYYPGSFRALIEAAEEADVHGGQLVVQLDMMDPEGQWIEADLTEQQRAGLSKLVLGQSTVPGDIWFITTAAAVDAALEEVTDLMQKNAEEQQADAQAEA